MVATMNPKEHAGVEELSDVLLDRFDVVKMGYPETAEREKEILVRYGLRLDNVEMPDDVINSIVTLVRATRQEPWSRELDQGASVRAGLALYENAQAVTLLRGQKQAGMESIRRVTTSSLASRIRPSPESKYYDEPFSLIDNLVADVLGDGG
jgi:MoxR-like ATPase